MPDSPSSRRQFLSQAGCGAVGASLLLSSLLSRRCGDALAKPERIAPLQALPGNDYKALVCIFLFGGNDAFNTLVPRGTAEYAQYSTSRQQLALTRESLLPISPLTTDGRQYGLHEGIPEIQKLFNDRKLAFVANVGSLVEPTKKASVDSGSARLPIGLCSHTDQLMHWQTSMPDRRANLGWAGRMADLLRASNTDPTPSMNISLGVTNLYQSGTEVVPYTIQNYLRGSVQVDGYGQAGLFNKLRTTAIDSLLEQEYQNVFIDTIAQKTKAAIDAHEKFSSALASGPLISTPFSETQVSKSLRMVARTIAANQKLGARRQTFFVMLGRWDHHDDLLNNHATMLPMLSRAMGEFNATLEELRLSENVVTFTASEFGRTLTTNRTGSDHGWGGVQMVMGRAVRGGEIHGTYPDLALDSELDVGRGSFIPTISCDEFFAELALWFGVPPSELATVLPNIGRFYTPGSGLPVGFLSGEKPLFADGFEPANRSGWSTSVG